MISAKKNKIVFVVGFPRSGTTWFSNLLNAHPEVIYRHEILGRCYQAFGEQLFNDLKFNHGLSNTQKKEFLSKLALADIETDRPPFFNKSVLKIPHPAFHKTAWLVVKSLPILNRLYQYLFTPRVNKKTMYLIKETRSTVNLDSILAGVSPDDILFLFREPYGAIASHVKGLKLKTMGGMGEEDNKNWLTTHSNRSYVKELYSQNFDFSQIGHVEMLAIKWRVYNDELLKLSQKFKQARFCHYDSFVRSPDELTGTLLSHLKLDYHSQVKDFILASSTEGSQKNILQKDASNEFYSVYRSADFNKEQWKDILSTDDIAIIDKHALHTYQQLCEASQ